MGEYFASGVCSYREMRHTKKETRVKSSLMENDCIDITACREGRDEIAEDERSPGRFRR